jgi:hypothetical protein
VNPAELEQLRLSLLRYLDDFGSSVFGLPTTRLVQHARAEGFDVDVRLVERELEYHVEKTLVVEIPKTLSPENRAWKLTAAGRDFRAQLQAR